MTDAGCWVPLLLLRLSVEYFPEAEPWPTQFVTLPPGKGSCDCDRCARPRVDLPCAMCVLSQRKPLLAWLQVVGAGRRCLVNAWPPHPRKL